MSESGAIDRILKTDNILEYKGDIRKDALKAREEIETFNRVNQIIQDPDRAKTTLGDVLKENYELNKKALNQALAEKGKGTNLNLIV